MILVTFITLSGVNFSVCFCSDFIEGGTDPEADEEGEWTKDEDTVIEYICQYLKAKIGIEVTSIDYELVAKPKK